MMFVSEAERRLYAEATRPNGYGKTAEHARVVAVVMSRMATAHGSRA